MEHIDRTERIALRLSDVLRYQVASVLGMHDEPILLTSKLLLLKLRDFPHVDDVPRPLSIPSIKVEGR